jgi:mannose-6-phosphate isomerase-like protein (cupin superfamily)
MNIFNRKNSYHTGDLKILTSYLLIGRANDSSRNISIQISDIPVNSQQPPHRHEPEQCYYIIKGKGLMKIENEEKVVGPGDAIHIPANKEHGIRNIGNEILEYLTANAPAFASDYESRFWPNPPRRSG